MKKILITGGSRGIGFNTLNSLVDLDLKIISLSRTIPSDIKPHPKIKNVKGDITKISSLQKDLWGATTVLHFAGLTHSADFKKYFEVNAEGTLNLIQRAETSNVNRFIYVSTQAIGVKGGAYSHSKEIAEEHIKKSKLNWTILRPSEIYGDNILGTVHTMQCIVKKFPIVPIFGNGMYSMNPLHLFDFTEFIKKVINDNEKTSFTKIYTLCGPHEISFLEFAKILICSFGKNKRIFHFPENSIKAFFLICKLMKINKFVPDQISRLKMKKSHNITLAKNDYDFRPKSFNYKR